MPKIEWNIPNDFWRTYVYDEVTDRPIGWSLFWYCSKCGEIYAKAVCEGRPFKAINGRCSYCSGDRWTIPGTLESLSTVGWNVHEAVVRYQLAREIAFLDSPQHPYNEKEV